MQLEGLWQYLHAAATLLVAAQVAWVLAWLVQPVAGLHAARQHVLGVIHVAAPAAHPGAGFRAEHGGDSGSCSLSACGAGYPHVTAHAALFRLNVWFDAQAGRAPRGPVQACLCASLALCKPATFTFNRYVQARLRASLLTYLGHRWPQPLSKVSHGCQQPPSPTSSPN